MIGRTISHYRILGELGRGGMGIVYKAEDTRLKRTVALKFFRPQAFGDEEQRQRFLREAQAAAALDHPNICTIYEIDETGEEIFISMAHIEGVTLKEKIESGPLEIGEALRVAIQLTRGLKAAHGRGVIHRDIKSTNIMVTNENHVKIMDFGL
ncbi:MAG: serine/threonine protein kinase, partial [Candidatus Latescibacterota bacterium]